MTGGAAFREWSRTLGLAQRVLDALVILGSGHAAFVMRLSEPSLPAHYQIALLLGTLLGLVIFPAAGLYRSWVLANPWRELRRLTMAWGLVLVALIVAFFVTKSAGAFSRLWLGLWAVNGWLLLVALRLALHLVLGVSHQRGWNARGVLIVGAGPFGRSIARRIRDETWTGLKVVGFVDDEMGLRGAVIDGLPVLGDTPSLPSLVTEDSIAEVWVALPLRAERKVQQILYDLRGSTVTLRYVPDMFGLRLLNHAVTQVAGMLLWDLSVSPMVGINRVVKAVEDRILAILVLVLVSPLFVVIALGVKLSSPGPVLFRQRRLGWDGKPITVYKFRTMVEHAEPPGQLTQACKGDRRVTRFGAVLRRTSLDELPQFINVLQGTMSVVGPRPHAVEHNDRYKELIEAYMQRHKVKPGITGWAQVNGWRGETDTLDKMRKRVEYDLYYIEHWSLWFDLRIIALTLFKGFMSANAY